MTTIRKEVEIDAPAEHVWDALRDFGGLVERLVPGYVIKAELEGHTRLITFHDGVVVRELLVSIEEDARRLVYTTTEEPLGFEYHGASCQVFDEGGSRSRFVWIVDVLPDQFAPILSPRMQDGIDVIKKTMESTFAPT
jgi:uncharacterized protein YndB with AHSA1/START domain